MTLSRAILIIIPLALCGCANDRVVYVHDGARPEKQFGDAPRPALTAAIGGVEAAPPHRNEVGSSWIKRHLVLEKRIAPAVINAPAAQVANRDPPPPIAAYAPRPASSRGPFPSKILSPDQFDPNRVF